MFCYVVLHTCLCINPILKNKRDDTLHAQKAEISHLQRRGNIYEFIATSLVIP